MSKHQKVLLHAGSSAVFSGGWRDVLLENSGILTNFCQASVQPFNLILDIYSSVCFPRPGLEAKNFNNLEGVEYHDPAC